MKFWNKFKRDRTSVFAYTGVTAFEEMIRVAEKGPMQVMVLENESFNLWPEGRMVYGMEIVKTNHTNVNEEIAYFSIDVVWKKDRPLRTGILRRIFGP